MFVHSCEIKGVLPPPPDLNKKGSSSEIKLLTGLDLLFHSLEVSGWPEKLRQIGPRQWNRRERTTLEIKSSSVNNLIGQGCMSFFFVDQIRTTWERGNTEPLWIPLSSPKKLHGWRCNIKKRYYFYMLKGWRKNFNKPAGDK